MAQTIKLKRSSVAGRAPTVNDLELGEVAINTYDGKMYIKKDVSGTESIVEISAAAADAILVEYQFTSTAGQTTYSGPDDNSEALSYTPNAIQVFMNGILLDPSIDFTATDHSSIVLAEAADANDYLQIFAFKKKISDGQVSVDTFTGDDSTVAFTLSVDPGDENNTRVFIDGVYQSKANYSVSGTTLTFSTAPPADTAVEVEIGNRVVTLDTLSDLDLPDDVRLRLGTGQDLQIYHDGSHSYIDDAGTGGLYLRSDNFRVLKGDGSERMIQADDDGAVLLYYDGSAKIQTTNDGVTVTGDVEADEFIGDVRGAVLFKAQAGETLAKGEVVYISGISGNTTVVSKADADDASKMPAFGLVAAAASSGNPVDIYTNGILSGIDTSSYSEGDELFVSTTAGALTATPPTGESAALQKIGKVTRSASSGSIFIVGAGRSNAVPNLDDGDIFIGNASNQAVSASLNTKIEDYLDGGTSTPTFAGITTTADLSFGDNDKAVFGAGSDLQIYHDGSSSYIVNTQGSLVISDSSSGAGDLSLQTNGSELSLFDSAGSKYMLRALTGGQVDLYHNGSTKLSTTATGIDVTGTVTADGLTISNPGGSSARFVYTNNDQTNLRIKLENSGSGGNTWELVGGQVGANNADFTIYDATNTAKRAVFSNNGDISFYEDTGTTAKFFWDASAEALGIGTSSPSAPLTVQGGTLSAATIQLKGGIYGNDNASIHSLYSLKFKADSSEAIAGRIISFAVGATDAMTIDSSGNVGIGVSSPSHKLDVDSGSAELMVNMNTTNADGGYIRFQSSGTSIADVGTGGQIISGGSATDFGLNVRGANNLLFATNTLERARIDGSGNLGLGVTPSAWGSGWTALQISGSGLALSGRGSSSELYLNANSHYDGTNWKYKLTAAASMYAQENSVHKWFNAPSGTAGNTISFTQAMTLDANGNLLVGTTSSNFNGQGLPLVVGSGSSNTGMTIYSGSTGYGTIQFADAVTTGADSYRGVISYKHGDEFMYFSTNATERMRIDASGNVNIGNGIAEEKRLVIDCSNPLLVLKETDQAVDSRVWAAQSIASKLYFRAMNDALSSATEVMVLDRTGNVGIGTSSPGGKLELKAGTSYTGHTGSALKLTNAGYRDGELTSFTEGSYFTHYFENYNGGNGRYYDRVLEIVCKGSPDGTYGESIIKFMGNPITNGSDVSEIMRLTGAGKVGIGTQSPASTLHVDSSAGAVVRLTRLGTNAGAYGQLEHDGTLLTITSTGATKFYNNTGESMRIASDGDFIVSNTDPRVASNYSTQAGLGWDESDLHAEIATTLDRSALEVGRNNANSGAVITIRQQGTSVGMIGTEGGDSLVIQSNGATGSGLRFHPSVGSIQPVRAGVTIDNTIDLGADTRRFKDLHLSGTAKIGLSSVFPGTTAALNVRSNTSAVQQFAIRVNKNNYADTGGHTTLIGFGNEPGGWSKGAIGFQRTTSYDVGDFLFCLNTDASGTTDVSTSDEKVRITAVGNVGIGTTSPASKLDISESYNNTFLKLSYSSSDSGAADYAHYSELLFQGGSTYNKAGVRSYSNAYQTGNAALAFWTQQHGGSYAERLRIMGDGQIRIDSGSSQRPIIESTNWGYSPSYRVALLGSASTSYNTTETGSITLSMGYDPSSNTSGSFTGDGREILFRRGAQFVTPNSADTGFYNYNLVLRDGNVGIGQPSPTEKLHIGNGESNYIRIHGAGSGDLASGLTITRGSGDGLSIYDNPYDSTSTFNAASHINFRTNNQSYRLYIKNDGNIGIGTSSPATKLHTILGSDGTVLRVEGLSGTYWYSGSDSLGMYIEGTSDIASRRQIRVQANNGGSTYTQYFVNGNTQSHSWTTSNTTRGYILSTGEWSIGSNDNVTISTDFVHSIGTINRTSLASSAYARLVIQERTGDWISFVNGTPVHFGTISASGSGVNYGSNSDYRLKENITELPNAIDRVKLLSPKRFNFISAPEETRDGFLAHEVQEVVPEAVVGEKDGYIASGNVIDSQGNILEENVNYPETLEEGTTWVETKREPKYQNLDNSHLVPLLTKALQEAIQRIENLEAEIASIKGE